MQNFIEISGIVETDLPHMDFLEKFIEWIELNGWSFGGGTCKVDENGNMIK